MSNRTQFKKNYLRDNTYSDIMSILVNYFWHWLYFNYSELDNGVMTTPKRCSFLSFIFTCLWILYLFLIIILVS